jgi:hypothetical protein
MKLVLKQPIVVEGVEYPFAMLSLSMSTNQNDLEKYFFSSNLTPYRIDENGAIEKLDEASLQMSVISVLESQYEQLGRDILTAFQNQLNRM